MTMREAVEIVLAGRRIANRVGHHFVIDESRMMSFGFSRADVKEIRRHAVEIESLLAKRLAKIPGGVGENERKE